MGNWNMGQLDNIDTEYQYCEIAGGLLAGGDSTVEYLPCRVLVVAGILSPWAVLITAVVPSSQIKTSTMVTFC